MPWWPLPGSTRRRKEKVKKEPQLQPRHNGHNPADQRTSMAHSLKFSKQISQQQEQLQPQRWRSQRQLSLSLGGSGGESFHYQHVLFCSSLQHLSWPTRARPMGMDITTRMTATPKLPLLIMFTARGVVVRSIGLFSRLRKSSYRTRPIFTPQTFTRGYPATSPTPAQSDRITGTKRTTVPGRPT